MNDNHDYHSEYPHLTWWGAIAFIVIAFSIYGLMVYWML